MFNIKHLNYEDKSGKLNIEASSKVKSKKYFPTYVINGENYIFKPLSKTKPFTTPMYSCAEVYWSNILNKYFDDKTPIYQLAFCHGYEKAEEKYYDRGSLVKNILNNDEHLVNVYEYFRENPDKHVDINDYTNYCMVFYDYVPIFKSKLIKENLSLGEDLARHVLMSVLKADQNYHYENVSFIVSNNKIKCIAPMIDHEFSTFFLCPDDINLNLIFFSDYLESLSGGIIFNNIKYIKNHYNNIYSEFINKLKILYEEYKDIRYENNIFLCDWNSHLWEVGHAKYKENNEEKAKELENKIQIKTINYEKFFEIINFEIKLTIEKLLKMEGDFN